MPNVTLVAFGGVLRRARQSSLLPVERLPMLISVVRGGIGPLELNTVTLMPSMSQLSQHEEFVNVMVTVEKLELELSVGDKEKV